MQPPTGDEEHQSPPPDRSGWAGNDYKHGLPVLNGGPDFKDQVRPPRNSAPRDRPVQASIPTIGDPSLVVAVPVQDEEAKSSTIDSLYCGCRVKRTNIRWIVFFAIALVAAIVIAVTVTLAVVADNDSKPVTSSSHPFFGATLTPTSSNLPQEPSPGPTMAPQAPSLMPTPFDDRAGAITDYMNIISFASPLRYPATETLSEEEEALAWLIEDDVLQLTADNAAGLFRLKQRFAVLTIWFRMGGSGWRENAGWLTNAHECDWSHMFCVERFFGTAGNQRIMSSLNFRDGGVVGQIPPDFALLSNDVQVLDFSNNRVTGSLPESFGQLTQIDILHLSNNPSLGGTYPSSMADWPGIVSVFVYSTALTGNLPVCENNKSFIAVIADCEELAFCSCCTSCCNPLPSIVPTAPVFGNCRN